MDNLIKAGRSINIINIKIKEHEEERKKLMDQITKIDEAIHDYKVISNTIMAGINEG